MASVPEFVVEGRRIFQPDDENISRVKFSKNFFSLSFMDKQVKVCVPDRPFEFS
jgi:hypothetical protein